MAAQFIAYGDLTAVEITAADTAVRAANAAVEVAGRIAFSQRRALVVAIVRGMDTLTPGERSRLVRYFTVTKRDR